MKKTTFKKEKIIQMNIRLTESVYKKLTMSAIRQSQQAFETVTAQDVVKMLISMHLSGEEK